MPMTGIFTIEQLRTLLGGQGVRTAYVKFLSAKQDNDKNQIYLGGGHCQTNVAERVWRW